MPYHVTHDQINRAATKVANWISNSNDYAKIYPIPRGGVPAAYAVAARLTVPWAMVDDQYQANVIVDDIVDSGTTASRYPSSKFYALFSKKPWPNTGELLNINRYLVFPWEGTLEESAEDIPLRLLQYIGEDPSREGLLETPKRFLKAWAHWTQGYKQNPADIFKVFDDGAEHYDEMIVVKDIPLYSHCEHHLAIFHGIAHIAYIPNGKIVGLSKMARLVDIFAQRLQVQERLTTQIADTIEEYLQPIGCGVVIKAHHTCMSSRGVQKQGTETITSALRGCIKTEPSARSEFFRLIGDK